MSNDCTAPPEWGRADGQSPPCVGSSPLHNMAPRKNANTPSRGNDETRKAQNALTKMDNLINKFDRALSGAKSSNKTSARLGRKVGGLVGQPGLGALAASKGAKLFGHGDYVVRSNSVMFPGQSLPKFSGEAGTRFVHKEFIKDIKCGTTLVDGSTVFDVETFALNPTNQSLFPWLSRIAPLYDQWIPNGIVFEFHSTSSEFNGSGQALGAVVLATDYDPFDPPPLSKQEMENSEYAISSRPCDNVRHGLECDTNTRPNHVLYTSTTNGAPLTAVDLGKFSVATKGMSTSGVTLGELWISYDITFLKKQLALTGSPAVIPDFFQANGFNDLQDPVTDGSYFAGLTDIQSSSPPMMVLTNAIDGGTSFIAFAEYLVGRSVLLTYNSDSTGVNTQVNVLDWTFTDGAVLTSRTSNVDEDKGFTFMFTLDIQAVGARAVLASDGTDTDASLWTVTSTLCNADLRVTQAVL